MCSICHSSPCLSRCPNAPDPPAAFKCHDCDEAIYPGDEYAKIDGVEYCERCIDSYPYCVLTPLLGGEWKTVQKGEKVYCVDCRCCDIYDPLPVGEEYGVIDGSVFCKDCIDEIPYCDLVTRMGHDWNTATEEDIYDGYDG